MAAIALRQDDETLKPLAFLFESYEPQYWWWEMYICGKRIVLTNVNFFLESAPKLQLISILAVVVADLEMTSSCAPYVEDSDDFFADIAQWCTVALLIFSIALEVEAIKPESSGAGLSFVLLLFAVIVVFVGYGIHYAWAGFKDIPNHLLSLRRRQEIKKKASRASRAAVVLHRHVNRGRSAEASLNPAPEDGEYFPERNSNEANAIGVDGEEMLFIEEVSLREIVQESLQAPNQNPTKETDRADCQGDPCLDEPVPDHGPNICRGMDNQLYQIMD